MIMKDHIIICGLGNIGYRTFELLAQANQQIVVISDMIRDEWRWQIEAMGGTFLLGDARNDKLLIEAGIKDAKAILALTDQDMVNVSIVMDARNLNPTIKIIARMLDTKLGKHISDAFGVHQIFSTSKIAAPIFTRSIYDISTIAQFDINDENFFISEIDNNPNANEHLAILATQAINSHSNKILVINSTNKHRKKPNKTLSFLKRFNYLRSPVFRNFRLFLFVLLCVIVTAALFLKWAMPLTYVDALYFVTTTVTTVGYGDINYLHSTPALKIFGCLLMLSGAAALAVLFSSITEIILTNKLPSILGGRPVPKKDHVIVVGAGHIGLRILITLIKEEIPAVIMENDTKGRYPEDINRQVALVEGFLRSTNTLRRANVDTAKAIVLISDDDVENLSVSLAAKKINPKITNIIQLFNSRLASRLQAELSLDKVLSVSDIAAPYFAAAVLGEKILLAIKWHHQLIFISEHPQRMEADTHSLKINNKIYNNIKIHTIHLKQTEKSE